MQGVLRLAPTGRCRALLGQAGQALLHPTRASLSSPRCFRSARRASHFCLSLLSLHPPSFVPLAPAATTRTTRTPTPTAATRPPATRQPPDTPTALRSTVFARRLCSPPSFHAAVVARPPSVRPCPPLPAAVMMRQAWIFAALFALFAMGSAFNLDALHMDGINEYLHYNEKRQASGTGNTPTSTPAASTSARPTSSAAPPPSSAAPPTSSAAPPPTSNTPDPTSEAPAESSQAPAPSSNNNDNTPDPTPTPSASAVTSEPTAAGSASRTPAASSSTPRTTAIVRTTPLVSTSVQLFTTVISTVVNGQASEITSTGSSTLVSTTGQATETIPPEAQSANNGDSGGLTDNNKKVIGGVVGGVGGALLLGGIALVFWRMKKRQSRVTEDDDDLMAGTGAALGDKTANTGSTPFQSNLEQYHNPGGRPNAAANF
ncbi:hypothetical protein C7974DRAFT_373603 [Boeremia exigua]|uniref:uncharacterized protein n=1 Tax=Boeremia exigua TaxID=749465 RepID=UPI001E8E11BE|nr:uncharacterized protein C7974DRAFT_373603 [Boeremia exigua]KAH6639359.1 hypothetical protein C7974DRAFT_373603 [Boeremia exigua]